MKRRAEPEMAVAEWQNSISFNKDTYIQKRIQFKLNEGRDREEKKKTRREREEKSESQPRQ